MKSGKKKILCIVQLPPPLHGASIMNSALVKSELINSNFNLNIIDLKFSKSVGELKKISLLKIFKSIKYLFTIFFKMNKFRPDIVYYNFTPNGFAFYRDSLYILLLKLYNSKIFLHIHSKGIKENIQKSSAKKYLYKMVLKKTFPICLSETLATDLQTVITTKPFIVPNGIQTIHISEKDLKKTFTDIPLILFLSNYIKSKGILILLDALQILKEKRYSFFCRLVGAPGDISIEILQKNIIEKQLSSFVEIIGPVYKDDKIREFQNADIFVLPTYFDAFPLVILEAFQFKIPVISTFEGGIPEMVVNNKTGLLAEGGNVEMLAEKIALLLDNKNLRIELGANGYKRFNELYTLKQFELNMYKVFTHNHSFSESRS